MNSNNLDKTNIINLYKEKNYQGVIKLGLKLLKKNFISLKKTHTISH